MSITRLALYALLAITMSNQHVYAQDAEETPADAATDGAEEAKDEGPLDPVLDVDDKFLAPFKIDDPNVLPESEWSKPNPAQEYDGSEPFQID